MNILDIGNISNISILITLSIYHVMIYLGRRSKEERYNLIFSAFTFFICLYIFFASNLQTYFFHNNPNFYSLVSNCIALAVVFMNILAIKIISKLLDFPVKYNKHFIISYIFFVLFFLSIFINFFIDWNIYISNIYIYTIILVSIGFVNYLIIFIYHIVKKKLYKKKIYILFIISIILISMDTLIPRIFNIKETVTAVSDFYIRNYHFGISIAALLYAYMISGKFNDEYKELKKYEDRLLKAHEGLEKRVHERTTSLAKINRQLKKEIEERKKTENERKQLEVKLLQAQKMEAIGALVGGVAHDLNNILSALVNYPELLLLEIPEDSPIRKTILTIKRSGEKAAAIVQDLLTLARRGVPVMEVVNINDIIIEYLKSSEYKKLKSYNPGLVVETEMQKDLVNIKEHMKNFWMNQQNRLEIQDGLHILQ